MVYVDLNKEEIEDILSNLDQCRSEGYLEWGDPAYSAMIKLQENLDLLKQWENN